MSTRHLADTVEILGLSPASKSLMIALAYVADDKGQVRATNHRLGEISGLADRTIRANLRKLETLRYIMAPANGAYRYHLASWNWPS